MIRFALKCASDHNFEAWFKSNDAFETLRSRGSVTCPECGASQVEKSLMAPGVSSKREAAPSEHSLARLRREVEAKSDYVGRDFARRARAMHEGDEATRPIYGEAALAEARDLLNDGIRIAPLPFIPKAKAN